MNITKLKLREMFSALLVSLLIFGQVFAQTVAPTKSVLAAEEQDFTAKINIQSIKDYTAALTTKEMEGRGTMQPGGDRAANWIADKFKEFGMKPLGDKGSFLQKIDFKETVLTSDTSFKLGNETLKLGEDWGIVPFSVGNKSASGEMVFVAYGIVLESIKRNDIEGIDLQGKIAVVIEGPPKGVSKSDWEKSNAQQIFIQNLWMKGVSGIIIIGN